MLNRHKAEQVRHFDDFKYNVSAETFERVKKYHAKNILELIGERPPAGAKILYVACGTGFEIKLMGEGIGTDIAFNCVKSAANLGFPAAVCDVEKLPFRDACFDYVFSNSFHHFYDFERSFSEMHRVCKTGGRITLGPESHRYSLDQYLYNTVFGYWKTEGRLVHLSPGTLKRLFRKYKLRDTAYYHKGIDPIALLPAVERAFDFLTDKLPNSLFFWAHFYITGIK